MEEPRIQIKGIGEGLLISLHEKRWKEAQELIYSTIEERSSFFTGARVAIDVGDISIKAAELSKFREKLSDKGLALWAVLSTSDTTINTSQVLGLSTNLGVRSSGIKPKKETTSFAGDQAVWVERTLRAGYKVETKCHVIVMGDVNPGAEIISAGNILVWGRLNGSVHAGAEGDKNARVCALELRPTQMRIAEIVVTPITGKQKSQPEMAFVKDNEIIIEHWNSRK